MTYPEMVSMLGGAGQAHLLRFWDELGEADRARLTEQIQSVPWELIRSIPWERYAYAGAPGEGGEIAPIPCLTRADIASCKAEFARIGNDAIRRGEVAAVLLAGGQGTRLGSSAPKGTFNIGIRKPLYIFEQLVRNLQAVTQEAGAYVPLFIMTSEKNYRATRAFFQKHEFFGYPREAVRFFKQNMAPCVDFAGKLLLEEKGRLARSPNGNGGWYVSLRRSGILRAFPQVKWFNVFAVDNVLQRIADPVFLGATIASGKDCGAKVVRKAAPEERVGVLCLRDGRPSVVEYYELPEEMANARDGTGELVYAYGVILNYLFKAETLRKIAAARIPVHVVKKKIPYIDEAGNKVVPGEVNGYKLETLILDMVGLMGDCLPFEVAREREFAPVKNRTGVDSVESAQNLLLANGVEL